LRICIIEFTFFHCPVL